MRSLSMFSFAMLGAVVVATIGAALAQAPVDPTAVVNAVIDKGCADSGALFKWAAGILAVPVAAKIMLLLKNPPAEGTWGRVVYDALRVAGLAVGKAAPMVMQQAAAKAALALLIIVPLLAACAEQTASGGTAAPDPLTQIGQFTVTDLQNADAIAVASGDTLGHACFPALIQFVQSLPMGQPTTTVSGALSAYETARVTRMHVESTVGGGLPDYLKLGCGGLLADERLFLIRLGALGAGAAAVVP